MDRKSSTVRIDLISDRVAPAEARPRAHGLESALTNGSFDTSNWAFDVLFEGMHDGACVVDRQGHILRSNSRMGLMLRSKDATFQGYAIADFIYSDNENIMSLVREELHYEACIVIEAYVHRMDGSCFPAELSITRIPQYETQAHWFCFFIRDVTLKEDVEQTRQQMQMIVNSSHAIVFKVQSGDHMAVVYLTENVEQYGYKTEAFTDGSLSLEDVIHPDDRNGFSQLIRDVVDQHTNEIDCELRVVARTGATHWMHCQASGIRDEDNQVLYIQGILMDISERRNIQKERDIMEVRLRQAQKMESLGQLSAGIAHEINSPTQFLGDSLHFLQHSFGDVVQLMEQYEQLRCAAESQHLLQHERALIHDVMTPTEKAFLLREIPRSLERALKGIQRITDIVWAMKEFSHPGTTEPVAADLNKAVKNAVLVAKNEWKYVAEMQLELSETLPLVQCVPGEINQALLNLIINAAHAVKEKRSDDKGAKGVIHIQTRVEEDVAVIDIADSGCGIPVDIQSRIFDPFFTTKDVGKGTGQGLTIVYNIIVHTHRGKISFESEAHAGTVFHVMLPLRDMDIDMMEDNNHG